LQASRRGALELIPRYRAMRAVGFGVLSFCFLSFRFVSIGSFYRDSYRPQSTKCSESPIFMSIAMLGLTPSVFSTLREANRFGVVPNPLQDSEQILKIRSLKNILENC